LPQLKDLNVLVIVNTDGPSQPPVEELLNFSRKARVENITDDAHGPKISCETI
jgi:hypothetical protein